MKRAISQEFSFWQLLAFSVPAVAMLVVSSLYTAVDGVFVSRFVGSDGLSAINIVLPLDTLAFGVGIMFGTGTSAIVGRKLGQGEAKAADQDLTLATLAAGVLGAVLSVLGLVFLEPLVRLLGASDRLLPHCLEYGRVLFASAFFTVIQVMYQALFITAGRGRIALWLTVGSGVLNLVLDWLLIGVLGMGMTGAALGTVSGRVLGGLFPLFYFLKERGTLRFCRPRWDPGMLALAMGNGSSEMVSNLAISATTLLFNLSMLALAGEDGLAAMTIVLYSQFVYTAVSMGFSTSAAPVISYHFGSGNTRYLQRLFRHCLGAIVLVTAAMMASAMLFARPLIALFTPTGGRGVRSGAARVLDLFVELPLRRVQHLFLFPVHGPFQRGGKRADLVSAHAGVRGGQHSASAPAAGAGRHLAGDSGGGGAHLPDRGGAGDPLRQRALPLPALRLFPAQTHKAADPVV